MTLTIKQQEEKVRALIDLIKHEEIFFTLFIHARSKNNSQSTPSTARKIDAPTLPAAHAFAIRAARKLPTQSHRLDIFQDGLLISTCSKNSSGQWQKWSIQAEPNEDRRYLDFDNDYQKIEDTTRAELAKQHELRALKLSEPSRTKRQLFIKETENPAHKIWQKQFETARRSLAQLQDKNDFDIAKMLEKISKKWSDHE